MVDSKAFMSYSLREVSATSKLSPYLLWPLAFESLLTPSSDLLFSLRNPGPQLVGIT
jgi:hypothetical protein